MSPLDNLVNQKIFQGKEKRAFSSDKVSIDFLINYLVNKGLEVVPVQKKGYFYCTIANADGSIEVCSDSRANLKPRNLNEAVCVAALKHFTKNDQDWEQIALALGLDYKELLKKARQ